MFQEIKTTLGRNLTNARGWRTNRKIVVFESDDWGSTRIQNKKTHDKLIKLNLSLSPHYDAMDCLERRIDLENLFSLLSSFKDSSGNPAIFTFNTVMGNPDFEKIKKENFHSFYHQHFHESYKSYYGEDNSLIWAEAIKRRVMLPQFHAREHLNCPLWMNDLRRNLKETRLAFDYGYYGLKTNTSSKFHKHYLATYHVNTKNDLKKVSSIVVDGLTLFKETFGFNSRSFIACNYIWPDELEDILWKYGVATIQGQRAQISPNLKTKNKKVKYHFTGQKNALGQNYLVRNVIFEPYINLDKDWVNSALKEVSEAFFWGKPAIICTHRINYASNLDGKHVDKALSELKMLLKEMLKKWPDIEFLSSDKIFDQKEALSYV